MLSYIFDLFDNLFLYLLVLGVHITNLSCSLAKPRRDK